jgi:hypothetical protein
MLEAVFAFEAEDAQVLADLEESVAFWGPALGRLGASLATAKIDRGGVGDA